MGKRDVSTKKLGCILIVFVVMIAGNSSVVFGGLLNNTPPKFINNIGKVKPGMTKQEVKNLLGDPNDTFTATAIKPNKSVSVSESWSYGGGSYDSVGNLVVGSAVGAATGSGLDMVLSKLPLSSFFGFRGHMLQTGMGLVYQTTANAVAPEDANYYATISFVDGIVTSKIYHAPEGSVTEDMRGPTALRTSHSQESPTHPVYATTTYNVYHERNCAELTTTDLIEFLSPQKARESGGVPCSTSLTYNPKVKS